MATDTKDSVLGIKERKLITDPIDDNNPVTVQLFQIL
jgi:hypothetical protein